MTINLSSLYLYGAVATFVASPQPILQVHAARLLMLPLYPSKSYTLLENEEAIDRYVRSFIADLDEERGSEEE